MNLRTDMADERNEALQEKTGGIECEFDEIDSVKISRITVTNEQGERALGKPKGRYITLDVPSFGENGELFDGRIGVLAGELRKLLPESGTVLVAGLGNEQITPDALGPKAASLLLATRHISRETAKAIGFGSLRSAAAVIPGVLGRTGIETAEIIDGIASKVKPSAVIVIDALASRRTERLGRTVQLSDTGVTPGSGVGNAGAKIDSAILGVPVIAIGVPTVVDALTLAQDLLEKNGSETVISYTENEERMMVTPREIDLVIERAAKYIAMGINCALQPGLDAKEILSVVS